MLEATLQFSLVGATIFFLFTIEPFAPDGSVNTRNVLIAAILIGFTLFVCSRMLMLIFLRSRQANMVAAVFAFSITQLLLLGSLNLVSGGSLFTVAIFNLLAVWYADKRLNTS